MNKQAYLLGYMEKKAITSHFGTSLNPVYDAGKTVGSFFGPGDPVKTKQLKQLMANKKKPNKVQQFMQMQNNIRALNPMGNMFSFNPILDTYNKVNAINSMMPKKAAIHPSLVEKIQNDPALQQRHNEVIAAAQQGLALRNKIKQFHKPGSAEWNEVRKFAAGPNATSKEDIIKSQGQDYYNAFNKHYKIGQ
jgi:hypothetical protein